MNDKIIYSINIEDIYEVAKQAFNKKPTESEINYIEEKIGERIAWFGVIEDLLKEFKEKKTVSKTNR